MCRTQVSNTVNTGRRVKTIGMLGGMSWESTALYYQLINEGIKARLGGLHSAKIAMVSVNFQQIESLQHRGDWAGASELLCTAARQVEAAGADGLLICTNTMHKVAPAIEASINVPLLHLADATARQIKARKMNAVGLLGTAFTMQQDFYKRRLTDNHNLDVIVPDDTDIEIVHRIIYDELCKGIVQQESREQYLRIIKDLQERGAEGVIEGCTEIVMLVQQQHTDVPLFDTTAIHAQAAVDWALEDQSA
jgi:aspartate racemase